MKVKVHYTIDTEYDFDDNELNELDIEPLSAAREWVKEDFIKIETRVDNVLPKYTSNIHFTFED